MDKTVAVYEAVSGSSFMGIHFTSDHTQRTEISMKLLLEFNVLINISLQNDGVLLYRLNRHDR